MLRSSGRVAFTVRLPAALHADLRRHAFESGQDLQDVMTAAASAFLSAGAPLHDPDCPLIGATAAEVAGVRAWLACWRRLAPATAAALLSLIQALGR